jgi:cysteine desulfurase
MKKPVYLDYQATTPCDPRVVEAMMPFFTEKFGNAHSVTHAFGWQAEAAGELAREQIAELIGAEAKEIIFTSGATEANNLAIKGLAQAQASLSPARNHLITLATEHKCVLDSCSRLERQGYRVTRLPVRPDGLLDLNDLAAAMTPETFLVSVMAVNNEIGVIQKLAEIGALCRAKGVTFHSDAAQALGKIRLDVNELNIDLMSLSSHKIYGPKGAGALYVRRRPRVRLIAEMDGGGQERGLRSGTLATPLLVGFGEACRIAGFEMEAEQARLRRLRDRLFQGVNGRLPGVSLNGSSDHRIAGNLNLSFAWVEGDQLLRGLTDIAVSTGSACSAASLEPSYVLRALGLNSELAHASLRIGLGRFTTEEEVDFAIEAIVSAVEKQRALSPLWAMHREGSSLVDP